MLVKLEQECMEKVEIDKRVKELEGIKECLTVEVMEKDR